MINHPPKHLGSIAMFYSHMNQNSSSNFQEECGGEEVKDILMLPELDLANDESQCISYDACTTLATAELYNL